MKKIIKVLIYLISVLLIFSCEKKDKTTVLKNPQEKRETKFQKNETKVEEQPTVLKIGIGRMLPYPGIEDFELKGKPLLYRSYNLHELVNGGSNVYMKYGFNAVISANYTDKTKPSRYVTVNLFQMGSPLGSFGYFSYYMDQFSEPCNLPTPQLEDEFIGDAVLNGNELVFYKEEYYVTISFMDEELEDEEKIKQAGKEILTNFGKNIARAIPHKGGYSNHLLEKLPQKGLCKRNILYQPDPLFGINGLENGFIVTYNINGKSGKLWFITKFNSKAIEDSFSTLKSLLKEIKPIPKLGNDAFIGSHEIVGEIIVTRKDNIIAGVINTFPDGSNGFPLEEKLNLLQSFISQ